MVACRGIELRFAGRAMCGQSNCGIQLGAHDQTGATRPRWFDPALLN